MRVRPLKIESFRVRGERDILRVLALCIGGADMNAQDGAEWLLELLREHGQRRRHIGMQIEIADAPAALVALAECDSTR